MSGASAAPEALLGFLGFFLAEGEGWTAVAMVTDEVGYPKEFRASIPVRPSPLQRVLYGDKLQQYLFAEVMGPQVLEALHSEVDIVFVNRREALAIDWVVPLAHVSADEPVGDSSSLVHHFVLGGQTAAVAVQGPVSDSMLTIARGVAPGEAFVRMKRALEVLGDQDERYR